MAKLKLPFELEKPSANEYVTQASQIGMYDKSLLEVIEDALLETESYDYSDFTIGKFYTLTGTTPSAPVTESTYSCFVTPVVKGQTVRLKTVGGSNARAYALTDEEKNILSVAPAGADYSSTAVELQVEQDGFLYVNDRNTVFQDVSIFILLNKSDTIKDNVEQLNKEIYSVKEYVTGTFVENGVIKGDGSFSSVSTFSIYSYAVSEGDVLRVRTAIPAGSTLADRIQVAAYNDNTFVEAVSSGNITTDVSYIVPTGVNKICVYSGNNNQQSVEKSISTGLKEEVSVLKEETSELKEDVEVLEEQLISSAEYSFSDFTDGAYYNLSGTSAPENPTSAAGWVSLCCPVKSGQTVTIIAYGGNAGRTYALTNNNRTIVAVAPEGADYSSGVEVQVTQTGYLYVNDNIYRLPATSVKVEVYGDTLDIIFENIGDMQEEIEELQDSVGQSSVSKIYNPRANFAKSGLKILDIGNSYTVDSTHYLPSLIQSAGIEDTYSLYRIVRSSGSFKTWVDCYNDSDTVKYSFALVAGTRLMNLPQGDYPVGDGSFFRTVLNDKWDIIIIHQVSTYSADASVWEGQTDGGYLKEFIRILKITNPHAQIGFLLTHSYPSGSSFNPEHSSTTRWGKIATATKWIMANYGIDFVIPYGTAVQNIRLCTSIVDSNELSTDGTHMADGLGDYVSACCYFQQLFGAMKGISVLGNTYRVTVDETVAGQVSVTDANALLAQKAAILACTDMFTLNNPSEITL